MPLTLTHSLIHSLSLCPFHFPKHRHENTTQRLSLMAFNNENAVDKNVTNYLFGHAIVSYLRLVKKNNKNEKEKNVSFQFYICHPCPSYLIKLIIP